MKRQINLQHSKAFLQREHLLLLFLGGGHRVPIIHAPVHRIRHGIVPRVTHTRARRQIDIAVLLIACLFLFELLLGGSKVGRCGRHRFASHLFGFAGGSIGRFVKEIHCWLGTVGMNKSARLERGD